VNEKFTYFVSILTLFAQSIFLNIMHPS
jgi:hypothetical protein